MLRSDDVGATWEEVLPFSASLSFINAREGWAASFDSLLKTYDSGRTWSALTPPLTDALLGPIDFADRETGILAASAVEDPAAGTRTVSLLQSSDGGETWVLTRERRGCLGEAALCLTTGGHALAVACGETLRSGDGGASWAAVTGLPSSGQPSCSGDSSFWVFGGGGAYRSLDGGLTWSVQPVPPGTSDISFVSERTGWATRPDGFASVVFRTDDGGETWQRQLTTPEFDLEPTPSTAVYFADEQYGVMVDVRLTIFFMGWRGEPRRFLTDDGGASWHEADLARGRAAVPDPRRFLGAIGLP